MTAFYSLGVGTIQLPLSRHPWGISTFLLEVGCSIKVSFPILFYIYTVFRDFCYWPLNRGWPLNRWLLNEGLTELEKAKCNLMAIQ